MAFKIQNGKSQLYIRRLKPSERRIDLAQRAEWRSGNSGTMKKSTPNIKGVISSAQKMIGIAGISVKPNVVPAPGATLSLQPQTTNELFDPFVGTGLLIPAHIDFVKQQVDAPNVGGKMTSRSATTKHAPQKHFMGGGALGGGVPGGFAGGASSGGFGGSAMAGMAATGGTMMAAGAFTGASAGTAGMGAIAGGGTGLGGVGPAAAAGLSPPPVSTMSMAPPPPPATIPNSPPENAAETADEIVENSSLTVPVEHLEFVANSASPQTVIPRPEIVALLRYAPLEKAYSTKDANKTPHQVTPITISELLEYRIKSNSLRYFNAENCYDELRKYKQKSSVGRTIDSLNDDLLTNITQYQGWIQILELVLGQIRYGQDVLDIGGRWLTHQNGNEVIKYAYGSFYPKGNKLHAPSTLADGFSEFLGFSSTSFYDNFSNSRIYLQLINDLSTALSYDYGLGSPTLFRDLGVEGEWRTGYEAGLKATADPDTTGDITGLPNSFEVLKGDTSEYGALPIDGFRLNAVGFGAGGEGGHTHSPVTHAGYEKFLALLPGNTGWSTGMGKDGNRTRLMVMALSREFSYSAAIGYLQGSSENAQVRDVTQPEFEKRFLGAVSSNGILDRNSPWAMRFHLDKSLVDQPNKLHPDGLTLPIYTAYTPPATGKANLPDNVFTAASFATISNNPSTGDSGKIFDWSPIGSNLVLPLEPSAISLDTTDGHMSVESGANFLLESIITPRHNRPLFNIAPFIKYGEAYRETISEITSITRRLVGSNTDGGGGKYPGTKLSPGRVFNLFLYRFRAIVSSMAMKGGLDTWLTLDEDAGGENSYSWDDTSNGVLDLDAGANQIKEGVRIASSGWTKDMYNQHGLFMDNAASPDMVAMVAAFKFTDDISKDGVGISEAQSTWEGDAYYNDNLENNGRMLGGFSNNTLPKYALLRMFLTYIVQRRIHAAHTDPEFGTAMGRKYPTAMASVLSNAQTSLKEEFGTTVLAGRAAGGEGSSSNPLLDPEGMGGQTMAGAGEHQTFLYFGDVPDGLLTGGVEGINPEDANTGNSMAGMYAVHGEGDLGAALASPDYNKFLVSWFASHMASVLLDSDWYRSDDYQTPKWFGKEYGTINADYLSKYSEGSGVPYGQQKPVVGVAMPLEAGYLGGTNQGTAWTEHMVKLQEWSYLPNAIDNDYNPGDKGNKIGELIGASTAWSTGEDISQQFALYPMFVSLHRWLTIACDPADTGTIFHQMYEVLDTLESSAKYWANPGKEAFDSGDVAKWSYLTNESKTGQSLTLTSGSTSKPWLTAWHKLSEYMLATFVFEVFYDFIVSHCSGNISASGFLGSTQNTRYSTVKQGWEDVQANLDGLSISFFDNGKMVGGEGDIADSWDYYDVPGLDNAMSQQGFMMFSPNAGGAGWFNINSADHYRHSTDIANGLSLVVNGEYMRQLHMYLNFLETDKDLSDLNSKFSVMQEDSSGDESTQPTSSYYTWKNFQNSSTYKNHYQGGTDQWDDKVVKADFAAIWDSVQANAIVEGWTVLEEIQHDLFKEDAFVRWSLAVLKGHSKKVKAATDSMKILMDTPGMLPTNIDMDKSLWQIMGPNAQIPGANADVATAWFKAKFAGLNESQLFLRHKRAIELYKAKQKTNSGMPILSEHVFDLYGPGMTLKQLRGTLGGGNASNNIFDDSVATNMKTMFVGIPQGMLNKLQFRSAVVMSSDDGQNPSMRGSRQRSSIINIKVHRISLTHPTIVFEPLNFFFDMFMFIQDDHFIRPAKNLPGLKKDNNWTMDQIVKWTHFSRFDTAKMDWAYAKAASWSPTGAKGITQTFGTKPSKSPFVHHGGTWWKESGPHDKSSTAPDEGWGHMSLSQVDSLLVNHVRSHTLAVYYRILTGLNLDEQAFPVPAAEFLTDRININDSAMKFLHAMAVNDSKRVDGGKNTPGSGVWVTLGPSLTIIPEEGATGELAGDTSLSLMDLEAGTMYPPGLSTPASLIMSGVPVSVTGKLPRAVKFQHDIPPDAITPAEFKNFRTMLQSLTFQSTAIVESANTCKLFDRVFAIPIDIDNFVISAAANSDGSGLNPDLEKLLNGKDPVLKKLEISDDVSVLFTGEYYRLDRDHSPGVSNDLNDNFIADQFFVEIQLVGTDVEPHIDTGAEGLYDPQ